MIVKGSFVLFETTGRGKKSNRFGRVVEVVYSNQRPRARKKLADPGSVRDHTSYVVADTNTGKLYWPRKVGTLHAERQVKDDE